MGFFEVAWVSCLFSPSWENSHKWFFICPKGMHLMFVKVCVSVAPYGLVLGHSICSCKVHHKLYFPLAPPGVLVI